MTATASNIYRRSAPNVVSTLEVLDVSSVFETSNGAETHTDRSVAIQRVWLSVFYDGSSYRAANGSVRTGTIRFYFQLLFNIVKAASSTPINARELGIVVAVEHRGLKQLALPLPEFSSFAAQSRRSFLAWLSYPCGYRRRGGLVLLVCFVWLFWSYHRVLFQPIIRSILNTSPRRSMK